MPHDHFVYFHEKVIVGSGLQTSKIGKSFLNSQPCNSDQAGFPPLLVDLQALGLGKGDIAAIRTLFTIEIAKNATLTIDGDRKLRLCGLIFFYKTLCADHL